MPDHARECRPLGQFLRANGARQQSQGLPEVFRRLPLDAVARPPRVIRSRTTHPTAHHAELQTAFSEANAFRRIARAIPRG